MLGRARVISYEDFKLARAKRAAKETKKEAKRITKEAKKSAKGAKKAERTDK